MSFASPSSYSSVQDLHRSVGAKGASAGVTETSWLRSASVMLRLEWCPFPRSGRPGGRRAGDC
jgi:hypothetical protein